MYVPPLLNTVDVVHLQLDHLHEAGIFEADEQGLLDGMELIPGERLNPCLGCLQGKAHKGTPPKSKSTVQRPGDLVTMDIIGPIEPQFHQGYSYILVSVGKNLVSVGKKSNVLYTWALKRNNDAIAESKEYLMFLKMTTSILLGCLPVCLCYIYHVVVLPDENTRAFGL